MSEWGNPHEQTSCILQPIHNCRKGTRGTETSKYPEEKKENFRASETTEGLKLSRLERTPDKREVGGSSPLKPTGFE